MRASNKQSSGSKEPISLKKKRPILLVIVPAYNEAKVIFSVLAELKNKLKDLRELNSQIIVVDDGSTDQTAEKAREAKVKVLCHRINRGLGGALGTGLEYARIHDFDLAVTFDADGQHDAGDIEKIIGPLLNNQADVVIGSRTLKGWWQVPLDRKIIIFLSNLLTNSLFGSYTTDSQSGFRAFNKKALQLIKVKTQRMEVSSEFFAEIRHFGLKYTEIPIKVIYTEYSRSKGQSNLNALEILIKLLLRLFR